MAEKVQDANSVIKMSEAGEELVKKLVSLYNSQRFVREGKELREELMSCGIEAGANLACIDSVADHAAKVGAANAALIGLTRVTYIANAMLMMELYTLKQVKPLLDYVGSLLRALKHLLQNVPETRRVIRVKTPLSVVNNPAAADSAYSEGEADLKSRTAPLTGSTTSYKPFI